MNVLVTGATGYIGGLLVPRLLSEGHTVRCLSREPARLAGRFAGAELVAGDIFDRASIERALAGIDVAYYLVHSMSNSGGDFAQSDRIAAHNFAAAASAAKLGRIVYLGGLGVDGERLSRHLRSRHEVGDILRESGVPVTEFRAAMILGAGSASFEMMRYLTERLPLMIAPKWVRTRGQPIAIGDVLAYLTQELERPTDSNVIYEIGGSDILSYAEMMSEYAKIRGIPSRAIVVPFFSPRLSSAWIHLVTPIPSSIARPLVDGLFNEVIVRDDRARRDFPIRPVSYAQAVLAALDRYNSTGPETTWFDAYDVRVLPGEFAGLSEGMLIDRRERAVRAGVHALFTVFAALGGARGWLHADFLWTIRGRLDRLVGGVGTRRGRRSPTDLRVGDAVDFWRVEKYERDSLLRLRAEMRVPGYAWLQFESLPREGGGSRLIQTAFFEPRGIFGYLYWYAVWPFHGWIFGNMASRIADAANRSESGDPNSPLSPAAT